MKRVSALQLGKSDAWLESALPASGRARLVALLATPFLGAILLTALAQIAIPLPWTPVPITGQTFGVALMALLFGARMGGASMAIYLSAGALGAPVFAGAASLARLGATVGYLIGMGLATFAVGALADRGWTRGFWRSLAAAYCGSFLVFGCGLLVLATYVPAGALLAAGLWPFLLGDLIKNSLAAGLASQVFRR